MMPNQYLTIIPARGGSKGIKDKNLVPIKNRPLISFTLESIRKAAISQNRVVVSTDSRRIASIAVEHGAEVPFLRPEILATDEAKTIDVVINALKYFYEMKERFDAVILLQPTSPLRTAEDIREAVGLFEQNESESLISGYKEETVNPSIMYKKRGAYAEPVSPNHNSGTRRQDNEAVYIRNGAIYITTCRFLLEKNKIISDHPLLYLMPKTRSLNVDTPDDLFLLERMLQI